MDNPAQMIMAVTGTVAAAIWILLFVSGNGKYGDIINTKSAGKYPLSSLFFIGFSIMKCLKINIRSEKYALKRSQNAELYGIKYAEFYTYLITGAQITYAATLFPVTMLIATCAGNAVLAFMGGAISVLMLFYLDSEIKKKVNERRDEILCDLPDMISRLTILVNAGMVLREAWGKIAVSSDSLLCREMLQTHNDIYNGMSESDAFIAFAERCGVKEVRKFISSLNQNIKKGGSELVNYLRMSADEQWEEKKNFIKRKSNAVEQKLLFPMILIFIAIIMMIIVPVFTNMI